MTRIPDPELRDAFDRIEEIWRNGRQLIESCYCRIDEHSRTILPRDEERPALVVPLDYDSVVPRQKRRDPFPALVREFSARLSVFASTCAGLLPTAERCETTDDRVDDIAPFWNYSFFTGIDAKMAY